jgi:hypothetical protein
MKLDDAVRAFLKELHHFDHAVSSADLVWQLIFPDRRGRWMHLHVVKYRDTYYVNHIDGNSCGLEAEKGKSVRVADSIGSSFHDDGRHDPAGRWEPMLSSARAWMKIVKQDWIRANRRVIQEYPLACRSGIVPNAIVRATLDDLYRLDKELGKAVCKKFIGLVEEGYFLGDKNTVVESMAAKDFFEYCRIAYIAGKRKEDQLDERLSGRKMYERHADGRHEGLLDIDENSNEEFAAWIDGKHPKKTTGGHPWEIKRGGNTTHIDLGVSRPPYAQKGFRVELRGASIGRLAETIRMFLAIHDAHLPISIADPEAIRRRLLAQDNIGILPTYDTLHRGNQQFREDQHVYDVLHYSDLGRHKRRIAPFIAWEPLPVFKPRDL